MELKHLRLITAIVEQGNIANARDRLCLTTSAISHQLRILEEDLGFRIFHRHRTSWTLTEAGAELYTLATQVLSTVDEKLYQLRATQQQSRAAIRVGSECYTFYLLFPHFLKRMSVLYPPLEIQMLYHTTHQPLTSLLQHEIDVAVVTARPVSGGLKSVGVFRDELFAVMHRENPLAELPYLEPHHFVTSHLIIHSYPLETVTVWEYFLKPNQVQPAKISPIPLTELALEMARANRGITCMPSWMLAHFAHQKDLVLKQISKHKLRRELYLVIRAEDRMESIMEDFVSNFQESVLYEYPQHVY